MALELGGESFAVAPRLVENDFTLEAWIRTSTSRAGTRVFEGRAIFDSDVIGAGSDFLSTILDDRVAFGIGGFADVGVQGVQVITTGEWVHVALTRNAVNGQLRIFVNGVLDGSAIGSNLDPLSGQPNLAFGGAPTARHFVGSMDEIRVWDVVRSANEISANMREHLSGSEPGLVGYYSFEDQALVQTADGSTQGNPATLVGNPTYVLSTHCVRRGRPSEHRQPRGPRSAPSQPGRERAATPVDAEGGAGAGFGSRRPRVARGQNRRPRRILVAENGARAPNQ